MADYCATTDPEIYLPSDHNQDSNLAGFVTRASSWVDSILGSIYNVPLPAYGATPATPGHIREITSRLAAYMGLCAEGVTNRLDDASFVVILKNEALDELREYVGEEPIARLPSETITGEAMTFGTDPAQDDEWEFTHGTRRINPATVEVSGYENGKDFKVHYDAPMRGWVLTRLTSDIADATTVSYEYTYYPNALEVEPKFAATAQRVRRA